MISVLLLANLTPGVSQSLPTPPVVGVKSADETDRQFFTAEQRLRMLYNRRSFGQMYDEGAMTLKRSTSRDTFVRMMSAFERRLGPYERGAVQSVQLYESGNQRVMFFRTDFKRAASVDEKISLEKENGVVRLAGYFLKPSSIRVRA